jgi:hypothetical protein
MLYPTQRQRGRRHREGAEEMKDNYCVVEYDVYDTFAKSTEVHRWIVRNDRLYEMEELVANNALIPSGEFRVLIAGVWPDDREEGIGSEVQNHEE